MPGLSAASKGPLPALAGAVLGCALCGGCAAIPLEHDRWTGHDKLEHFATAAAIGAGYIRAAGAPDHAVRSRNEAVTLVLTLGGMKELHDARFPGKGWSWKDMAWNLAGALFGAGLANEPGP